MARIRELDGLRGLAAVLVVLHHAWVYRGDAAWLRPPSALADVGWCGVDVFLALSGFLITGLLLDARRTGRWDDFARRRARRLLPLFALTVAAAAIVAPWAGSPGPLVLHPLLLGDVAVAVAGTAEPLHLGVGWSVAAEVKLYLGWGALVAVLPRRALLPVAVCGVLLAPALRWLAWTASGSFVPAFVLAPCRADAFLIGAIALLARDRLRSAAPFAAVGAWTAWGALVAAGAVDRSSPVFLTIGLWLVPAATAATVLVAERVPLLAARPLVALGTVSYGLYLLHPWAWALVRTGLDRLGAPDGAASPGRALAEGGLTLLLSVGLASASWRWIERPARRADVDRAVGSRVGG